MKLYLTIATPPGDLPDLDSIARWTGSQAESASARKELVELGFKRKDLTTHEIEVPTKKEELMAFLNLLVFGPNVVAAVEKLTA